MLTAQYSIHIVTSINISLRTAVPHWFDEILSDLFTGNKWHSLVSELHCLLVAKQTASQCSD